MIFGPTLRIIRSSAASLCCAAALVMLALPAQAQSVRIKDIADFEGIRDNMLVGYGIVAGLAGTGDDLSKVIFTRESLLGMLERLGVNARTTNANGTATNELRTKNIATVMVTATLPPFARQGTKLDVQVSAMGDSQSLLGGVLLVTPMMGADGEVYAVAQANLTIRVTETPQVSQPGAFAPGATGLPGQLNQDQVINVPQPRVGADGRPVLDASGNPVFDMVPQVVPGSRQGGGLGGGAQTVVVPRTSIEVDDQSGRRLAMVPSGVTLGELVNGLNALGVGPRDLITILQAIKAAGALQADIEIM